MDTVSDEHLVFLNIQTGKFVLLTSEVLNAAEEGEDTDDFPEWEQEMIQEAADVLDSADYRELPDRFDINEYSIMERFCSSVEDERVSNRLWRSIQGKGAFRYFRDTVHDCGIVDDWYAFREEAFRAIAIEWLESNGVAYSDEKQGRNSNGNIES